ncbi:MAG: rhodanese-like domain-containing protein [Elusimicrobiota bacterium]
MKTLLLAALACALALGCRRMRSSSEGDLAPAAAAELAARPGTLVLDVRTPEENVRGRIKGARLIPIGELEDRLGDLPQDKSTPILVYCAAGGRSSRAASLLRARGYAESFNLSGGISAWEDAGLPVER